MLLFSMARKTMEIAFFPKKVVELFERLGYQKSKKGNYWKIYNDAYYNKEPIEFNAIAICAKNGETRYVKWYIKNIHDSTQKLDKMIALHISEQFKQESELLAKKLKKAQE